MTGYRTLISARDLVAKVAPDAFASEEDRLVFPQGVLLPLSLRSATLTFERGLNGLQSENFIVPGIPVIYSVYVKRMIPDSAARALKARRTLMEAFLMAAAEKVGRRPSMAEQTADQIMDLTESRITMGDPTYEVLLLAAYFVPHEALPHGEEVRRIVSSLMRSKGLIPQTLYYVPQEALKHLQPGGDQVLPLDKTMLMIESVLPLIPRPQREVPLSRDAIWLGNHQLNGRDVYYSFVDGFDPTAEKPPHATTLVLGEMGSGKTTLMRSMIVQRLLQGRTVVTIDPEGENSKICEALGGVSLPMSIPEREDTCLLHPLEGESAAELFAAAQFVLASLRSPLNQEELAVLHDAIQRRWEKQPGPISLADLREMLAASASPVVAPLVSVLRIYSEGGLLSGLFDRPKALVSLDLFDSQAKATWINFDLSTLREENRNVVYYVLSWFIYHAVLHGKKPFDVFIDEGWRLLGQGGVFRDMLDELGRRARKRGIALVLATHLPTDVGPTVIGMASTALVGRLGLEEAFRFLRGIGIPESEAKMRAEQIATLPPRVFLAIPAARRGALFPVRIVVPDAWLEFWKKKGVFGY